VTKVKYWGNSPVGIAQSWGMHPGLTLKLASRLGVVVVPRHNYLTLHNRQWSDVIKCGGEVAESRT